MSNETLAADEQNPEDTKDKPPSFADFAAFLPYACSQMSIDTPIEVITVAAAIDTPTDKKARSTRPSMTRTVGSDSNISLNADIHNTVRQPSEVEEEVPVKVTCHYDKLNKLIGIEVSKCTLPRDVLQVISLIVVHQPQLQFITIRANINKYTLPEVHKIQQATRLTDVCFDDTFVKEANYYVLLNEYSMIKNMSLSRCKLNDEAIKMIFDRLRYPTQGSKTLRSLILSSNHITDKGCVYIAEAMRTNRCLRNLNLADNRISDTGAGTLFDKMLAFPLSFDEVIETKSRRFSYWRERPVELKTPRTSRNSVSISSDKSKKAKSPILERTKKANVKIESEINGEDFLDPYNIENVTIIDDVHYSKGNNILTYLNLAYNRLGYHSVTKLFKVLQHQKIHAVKDKGLMRVVLNGNLIPRDCTEMVEVEKIMNSFLLPIRRGTSIRSARNTGGSFKKMM